MCLCMRFTSHLDSKPRKVTAHKNLRYTLQTPKGTAMAPETFYFSVEKKSKILTKCEKSQYGSSSLKNTVAEIHQNIAPNQTPSGTKTAQHQILLLALFLGIPIQKLCTQYLSKKKDACVIWFCISKGVCSTHPETLPRPTSRVISPNQPVLEGYVDVREATWG